MQKISLWTIASVAPFLFMRQILYAVCTVKDKIAQGTALFCKNHGIGTINVAPKLYLLIERHSSALTHAVDFI